MNTKRLWPIALGLALVMVMPAVGCTPTAAPQNQSPVEVVSVVGPLSPINPGGPIVEITLKNAATQPVVSLSASLVLGRPFNFDFAVTSASPLSPGKSASARLTLIGGGFSDNTSYPLTINGALQDGTTFTETEPVQITAPK